MNEVNMSQSPNDSFPSAMNLAAAIGVKRRLIPAVTALRDTIAAKAAKWQDFVKIAHVILTLIVLFYGVIGMGALAQKNGTSSSSKMSSQQMMDKKNHMSTTEKAEMFDMMTNNNKMEAMKMAGHDMSKMSAQESMEIMRNLTPEQRAGMFDKMPLDTQMATIRIAMKQQRKGN